MNFKTRTSFEQRKSESVRIIAKYPDRIPIICEKSSSSNINVIDKNKYLVPNDLTIGQFLYVIRRRIKLKPEQAIFLFVNNIVPSSSEQISLLYDRYRDNDGFLYVSYSGENTFG